MKHHRLPLPTGSPRLDTIHRAAYICASPSLGSGCIGLDVRGLTAKLARNGHLKLPLTSQAALCYGLSFELSLQLSDRQPTSHQPLSSDKDAPGTPRKYRNFSCRSSIPALAGVPWVIEHPWAPLGLNPKTQDRPTLYTPNLQRFSLSAPAVLLQDATYQAFTAWHPLSGIDARPPLSPKTLLVWRRRRGLPSLSGFPLAAPPSALSKAARHSRDSLSYRPPFGVSVLERRRNYSYASTHCLGDAQSIHPLVRGAAVPLGRNLPQ